MKTIATRNSVTDYDTMGQYDDFGALYNAITITAEHWDDLDEYDRNVPMPDITTWYEDIVLGWAAGTPEHHTIEIYTIAGLPEDIEAYDYDDLSDEQREEIADRANACVNNPHDDDLAHRAGLQHLGYAESGANMRETLANIVRLLDSIGYDNQISF